MDLRAALRSAGYEATDIEPLGGGCVSAVFAVRTADGRHVVAKFDESGRASLPVEAEMLRYLAANTGLPVPAVRHASAELLIMAHMPGDSRFTSVAERHAAELLAALHTHTAPAYGFDRDTLIGGLLQPNERLASWLTFFRDRRLLYMAGEAARVGRLPRAVAGRVEALAARLGDWLYEPERPSLIHGDVWTTNILAVGDRVTAFLDPAIYFAHNEIELAFTTLFHTFGRDFYTRYDELNPIAPGFFEERKDLYNLYPLLVHVRLFGGSYVASVDQTLRKFGF